MKRILFFISFLTLLSSCEDVIEVSVPNSEPRLSIDAHFNLFTDENPLRLEGGVRLTLTANYFNNTVPLVKDATVFITDLTTANQYPLIYNPSTEYYTPKNPEILINYDTQYRLTVIYKEEVYQGVSKFISVAPISSVIQGTKTLFEGDETEVIVSFKDDAAATNYYLYDFGFNILRPIEDLFFQGQEFVFSNFYSSDEVRPGQSITIKAFGIEKQYFTYISLILQQTGNGGPFQPLPATTRGNIINTTAFDNYPLGYFLISEAYESDLLIQ
jgi:hypothetical protein